MGKDTPNLWPCGLFCTLVYIYLGVEQAFLNLVQCANRTLLQAPFSEFAIFNFVHLADALFSLALIRLVCFWMSKGAWELWGDNLWGPQSG